MSHCRLCNSPNLETAFEFGNQPIVHHLLNSADEHFDTFPFNIAYCPNCGFMQMTSFPDREIVYKNYITLSSWKPQPHAKNFLERIIQLFGLLPDNRILEIGSNDGGFIELLHSVGYFNCLGVEPTQDASEIAIKKGLPVTRGFYGLESLDDYRKLLPEPDLIVSRQVIEHISDLDSFLSAAHAHLAPTGGLALEFPDHTMNFESLDYSFWEEHVNYFTIHTIRQLLSKHGFEIFHYESTLFSGKCLFVFARRVKSVVPPQYEAHNHNLARQYIRLFPRFCHDLHQFLGSHKNNGDLVMYGCGARSCNFINLTGSAHFFDRIVDDRAEKQGKFAPGSRLPVTSSEDLEPSVSVALGVNSENEFNVIRRKRLAKSFSILPPSNLLPSFWQSMALLMNG